ncbi:SNF2 helicase associated domain-containing protein [Guptibacillus hwajinpoensis]|uniref:SNF2 helicase associated domain-containing protein n=1 Tax=Guptibacillus hwajinpoensis TaxID=208199 RepID=UPI001CFD6FA2|nr:SNF2 helicase associated domain-containing protein [Pseudalkalibacillus hwajinpoensis]
MERKINNNLIKEMCGDLSFKKGEAYFHSDKVSFHHKSSREYEATVHGVEDFHVTIKTDRNGHLQAACSCPSLATFQKDCQHIAAVLIAIQHFQQNETVGQNDHLGENFMTLFTDKPAQRSGQQRYFEKRKVLDVIFTFKSVSISDQNLLGVELAVEQVKVPFIRDFLHDVNERRISEDSPWVTYNPEIHCFSNQADAILHHLIRVARDESAFLESISLSLAERDRSVMLMISPSSWSSLLPLVTGTARVEHKGTLYDHLKVGDESLPLRFLIDRGDEENCHITIKGFDRLTVLNAYQSILFQGMVFQLEPREFNRIVELKRMLPSGTNQIPIPYAQMDHFLEKVVPDLKRMGHVELSRAFRETYMKTPLKARLYLDRLKNRLLAGLEFQYDEVVIQPLERRDVPGSTIIRDIEKEEEILNLMEESGFSKTDGGYMMQNEALEYEFLYHTVPKLESILKLYATTAVRNRLVRKKHYPKINVKLKKRERTNWLEFKFDMDGISDNQVREILAALEEKRKYYRLRNGSLLSLETKEMEEMHEFLTNVPPQEPFEPYFSVPVTKSASLMGTIETNSMFQADESFRAFLDTLRHPDPEAFQVPTSLEHVLRDYQVEGYQWMKTLASYGFGGVLADDMGLGKTLQSLTFIVSELETIRAQDKPVLIVCPSSLSYNWFNEIKKFAPELQALIIDGNQSTREKLQKRSNEMDVIITSYPLLRRDSNWYEKQRFHTAFFDEAQAFKNPSTQTARSVKKIKADYRFGLTGTPVENAIEELWSIYHVVFPELFKDMKAYSNLTKKTIARRVQPFLLRRMKEDVLAELPEKLESLELTDLLPEQKKLYAAYLAKLRTDTLKHLDRDTIRKNRIKILAGLTRLRQICCHPSLFVEGYKGSSAKFEQLLQIIEDSRRSGRRMLIFSQFTKMLDLIGRELAARGQSFFYLDGETPAEERVETCDRFNEGERDVFLISLKAGGTGLNLTGADTVVLYDLWWNPAVEEQAADRTHRIGQENVVNVMKLVARGTIEEKMNELQEKKRELISALIDSEEKAKTSLTEEDIREILTDS